MVKKRDSVRDEELPPEYDGYETYTRMCRESKGFDVCPLGGNFVGNISELTHPGSIAKATDIARRALDLHNETHNTDLKFDTLIKSNGQIVGGAMYYFTFTALSIKDGKLDTYQAKVWKQVSGELKILIFRKKPKKIVRRFLVPKGMFFLFRNDLKKLLKDLLQFADISYFKVTDIASKKWGSMSDLEKVMYRYKRDLKYEDVAELCKPYLNEASALHYYSWVTIWAPYYVQNLGALP